MLSGLKRFLVDPLPSKNIIFRSMKRLIPYCSDFGRPAYKHCIYSASFLARQLKKKKISVIEFGVAGGNGLICIEKICEQATKKLGIQYEIYGFDTGKGLPEPQDHRDIPYVWDSGFYKMDQEKLMRHLKCSKLIIGDVAETQRNFFKTYQPAPIGCIFFDLDYYTSTKNALQIFSNPDDNFYLPRIYCYFDDVETIESVGERLAIKEFNQEHDSKKIENNYAVQQIMEDFGWKVFEFHNFKHHLYNLPLAMNYQLPLRIQ